MFLRALVLTILIMCTVAATLPISDSLAHWASRPSASRRANGRYARRHSRAWWRRYRARLRRQRAAAAERRKRRAAVLTAAKPKLISPFAPAANHASATTATGLANNLMLPDMPLPSTASLSSITPVTSPTPVIALPASKDALTDASKAMPRVAAAVAASPLPSGWSSTASNHAGEMRFNVRAADGRVRSSAVWSRVNLQSAAPAATDSRSKTFGGVPVTLLRRTVINRMVAEGGWVTNDVQRQFGERRVFVVTAQSMAASGERRAWTFYFTEADGQVYSLATNAPAEFADSLAAESEQAVVALGSRRAAGSTTARHQQ
jgi:hypothetical protein